MLLEENNLTANRGFPIKYHHENYNFTISFKIDVKVRYSIFYRYMDCILFNNKV